MRIGRWHLCVCVVPKKPYISDRCHCCPRVMIVTRMRYVRDLVVDFWLNATPQISNQLRRHSNGKQAHGTGLIHRTTARPSTNASAATTPTLAPRHRANDSTPSLDLE